MRTPPYQRHLFDNDETTCVTVGPDPLSLIIHWDPAEKNSPRDNVASYYCQPEFFVNVTHGHDVGISVYRHSGVLDETNVVGRVLEYQKCPLIGQSTIQGLVRSKFRCQCTAKCNVMIDAALTEGSAISESGLCFLKIYD